MPFTEQNAVEHFIIHQLTGVNLNAAHGHILNDDGSSYDAEPKWRYVEPELLHRELTDVLAEKELKQALCRLNPAIAAQPDRADEVIHKLRAILITVNTVGLVRANQEFSRWICPKDFFSALPSRRGFFFSPILRSEKVCCYTQITGLSY